MYHWNNCRLLLFRINQNVKQLVRFTIFTRFTITPFRSSQTVADRRKNEVPIYSRLKKGHWLFMRACWKGRLSVEDRWCDKCTIQVNSLRAGYGAVRYILLTSWWLASHPTVTSLCWSASCKAEWVESRVSESSDCKWCIGENMVTRLGRSGEERLFPIWDLNDFN